MYKNYREFINKRITRACQQTEENTTEMSERSGRKEFLNNTTEEQQKKQTASNQKQRERQFVDECDHIIYL